MFLPRSLMTHFLLSPVNTFEFLFNYLTFQKHLALLMITLFWKQCHPLALETVVCVFQVSEDRLSGLSSDTDLAAWPWEATQHLWDSVSSWPLVAQSCPTPSHTMDCNPPGTPVHGILQTRILVWIAIPFSRGSFQPRDRTHVSFIGRRVLYHWTI